MNPRPSDYEEPVIPTELLSWYVFLMNFSIIKLSYTLRRAGSSKLRNIFPKHLAIKNPKNDSMLNTNVQHIYNQEKEK